jgi:hypothetical protein
MKRKKGCMSGLKSCSQSILKLKGKLLRQYRSGILSGKLFKVQSDQVLVRAARRLEIVFRILKPSKKFIEVG